MEKGPRIFGVGILSLIIGLVLFSVMSVVIHNCTNIMVIPQNENNNEAPENIVEDSIPTVVVIADRGDYIFKENILNQTWIYGGINAKGIVIEYHIGLSYLRDQEFVSYQYYPLELPQLISFGRFTLRAIDATQNNITLIYP
jgi:hypothetical protein